MRRLMTGLLLMLVAAALAGPAAAKEANVELGSTPAGLGPGDPWNLGIQVFADPGALAKADPPVVTIRNSSGEETRFPAEPLGTEPGTYTATVVFPEAGTWTYEVYDSATGRTYEYDPVVIEGPAVAPTAGAPATRNRPQPPPRTTASRSGRFSAAASGSPSSPPASLSSYADTARPPRKRASGIIHPVGAGLDPPLLLDWAGARPRPRRPRQLQGDVLGHGSRRRSGARATRRRAGGCRASRRPTAARARWTRSSRRSAASGEPRLWPTRSAVRSRPRTDCSPTALRLSRARRRPVSGASRKPIATPGPLRRTARESSSSQPLGQGASRVLVAVGGTASTDGGEGAVEALQEASVKVELVVLSDVRTPWEDAPRVFGPQKGADPATVARLERRLEELAARAPRNPTGVSMTGAGGGLAGGLWAFCGAELVPGAPFVLDAIGFDAKLR